MSDHVKPRILSLGESCCGCGSCVSSCPVACLYVDEDSAGFRYPQCDELRCTRCGVCDKSCSILNNSDGISSYKECYWAFVDDPALRQRSSSGGVFGAIALLTLRDGGVVYGAAYENGDPTSVVHMRIAQIEDLCLAVGSKYIQSEIKREVYERVVEDVSMGRTVLFSGTACQVAAVRRYVSMRVGDASKLFFVEVICRGVPSGKLWREWIRYVGARKNAEVVSVNFRDKGCGWEDFCIKYTFDDGSSLSPRHQDDWFFSRAYVSGASIRPSCMTCHAKSRSGCDILLGDFWGIELLHPEIDAYEGVSAVLITSPKGHGLFMKVKSVLKCGTVPFGEIYFGHPSVKKPAHPYKSYSGFMRDVKAGVGIVELIEKWDFTRGIVERVRDRLSRTARRLAR